MYTYRARLLRRIDEGTAELELDLGFHVLLTCRLGVESDQLSALSGQPSAGPQPPPLIATVHKRGPGDYAATLQPVETLEGWNVHTLSPSHVPTLWHYPATATYVIDGDTFDAVVDLGFGIAIKERFRLSGVQAPEIIGISGTAQEYRQGIEAKRYVARRLAENGDAMVMATTKRGKWRRWLAEVHLADSQHTLNRELIENGLADDWASWLRSRADRDAVLARVELDRQLRAALDARAKAQGISAGQLIRQILERFLAS